MWQWSTLLLAIREKTNTPNLSLLQCINAEKVDNCRSSARYMRTQIKPVHSLTDESLTIFWYQDWQHNSPMWSAGMKLSLFNTLYYCNVQGITIDRTVVCMIGHFNPGQAHVAPKCSLKYEWAVYDRLQRFQNNCQWQRCKENDSSTGDTNIWNTHNVNMRIE